MSEQNGSAGTQIADAVVTDPDDYNRQQRFKEIHDARQRISEFLSEMQMPDDGGGVYYPKEATRLSYFVSLYIMELEPLIVRSEIDDSELVPDRLRFDSLRSFAAAMGMKPDEDPREQSPSVQQSMGYFSAANRFYARVGMGLELEEDDGDAGFNYADILAEGPPGGDTPQLDPEDSE